MLFYLLAICAYRLQEWSFLNAENSSYFVAFFDDTVGFHDIKVFSNVTIV